MLIKDKKVIIIILIVIMQSSFVLGQMANIDWKMTNVGKIRQLLTNMGTWDDSYENGPKTSYTGLIYSEFPAGSNEEHLYQAGIWIGGLNPDGDTLVSVTRTHFTPTEFYPSAEPWDTIWVVTKGEAVDIPYWPNYSAVSDQDFVCRYSDYNILNIADHTPLYLDVIQRAYTWSSPPLDEFIVYNYDIIPTKHDITNVYIGVWIHGEIGNADVGTNFIDEYTLLYPEKQMVIDEDGPDGDDGPSISPMGVKILDPVDETLTWTYKWHTHASLGAYKRDAYRYKDAMANGEIMQNRPDLARFHVSVCFGEYDTLKVGDTLHFELGQIFGIGREGVFANADYLDFLRERDYKVPFPPPSPIVVVNKSSHQVNLNWEPQADNVNPEIYIDQYRGDLSPQPFEGYRVYKSTISAQGPWTLLAEYDIDNNQYGNNTGLVHEYTDVGLLNNVEYFYTVTAFSKPDSVTHFPSQESSRNANAITVVPSTVQPDNVGKVAVVPNPYRGDIAYHSYNPQWEKPGGTRQQWMEQDRRIQFINLPDGCNIKIYTASGDLVYKHQHVGSMGYWDWNLTSSVGQAISSGIYLFTVQDKKTNDVQVGKFVIIK